ncbi:MAG: hypothetical protein A2527_01605 [Candidatus Lambdaproteobacteria bacterium RIFOXYD2_FULL_50_16]|uniref:Chemotaxis protein n=1 Tax=Candidatus Lambdaproteobacteria bacterium RIFOXYD2_FULL_50_16 TaxID=1817772 RepID=A0A1F6G5K4_9PROT|nr:MAG: hypothetical protein A2527_01605 [Candidatus Lambdaproteobacteria bacterium RIFOXYD2_FULL_50_16]
MQLKLRSKLLILCLVISLVPFLILALVSINQSSSAIESGVFDRLNAVRETKASQVEDYFGTIRNQILSLAESHTTVEAMIELKTGFHKIETDQKFSEGERKAMDQNLRDYYTNQFLPKLNQNLSPPAKVDTYWPGDEKARIFQYKYISNNPKPVGSKHELDVVADGSDYAKAHAKFHPFFRNYLEKFGFYDIFLIDPKSGQVIYSVFKEADFANSLLNGPYQNTNLAEVFKAAASSGDRSFVKLVDFKSYPPSYASAASFIASPIYEGSELVGVLVFQMPVDKINNIMTSNKEWEKTGLGESGETYLVGDDFRLRSEPRFLIEDKVGYLKLMRQVGMSETDAKKIENTGTAIGVQTVRTPGTEAAFAGKTDHEIYDDYRGVAALSSYRPLKVEDVSWVLMAEMDEGEALAAIGKLELYMAVLALVISVLVVFIALIFTNKITGPILKLTKMMVHIEQDKDFTQRIAVENKDEVGEIAVAMNHLLDSLQSSFQKIAEGTDTLSAATLELSATATQIQKATEEVNQGIESSASATTEMSTNLGELAQSVNDMAKASGEISGLSSQAQTGARNSQQSMNDTQKAIEKISESSNKIGSIINVITEISNQTNLLSLNAAIEAAKAGEQGKGFAVVAEEVRNLADRSGTQVNQIRNLIEVSSANVKEGTEVVGKTGQTLRGITDQVGQISKSINEMTLGMTEQNQRAREISLAVEEIAKVSDSNSSAMNELASSVTQVEATIEDLSKMADRLKQEVNRFRV